MTDKNKLLASTTWSMAKCNKYRIEQCEKCIDKQGCYTYITLKDVLS
jgi:hypothetical protein